METVERKYLENVSGKHQKFYDIWVENDGDIYNVNARYGRIGNNPQSSHKGSFENYDMALNEMEKVVKSKVKKGYEVK